MLEASNRFWEFHVITLTLMCKPCVLSLAKFKYLGVFKTYVLHRKKFATEKKCGFCSIFYCELPEFKSLNKGRLGWNIVGFSKFSPE